MARGCDSRPGPQILGYANSDARALIGSAEEVIDRFAALEAAGVAYVLLSGQGSRANLRRFAERVMPKFGTT